MRQFASILAALVTILLVPLGAAMAVDIQVTPGAKPAGMTYEGGGRIGGDTVFDATAIPALPFFDTKMCVYANAPGNLIACSDDACGSTGWQSKLCNVSLSPGNAHHIVVDGYGGERGEYAFTIALGLCYASGVNDDVVGVGRPRLLSAGPNPVVLGSAGGSPARAVVRFALPCDARVGLDIYGPSGSHVRARG